MKRATVLALASGLLITIGALPRVAHATTAVGPKTYYLALGDSLAYGYQPNYNFNSGYANDFYANLRSHGTTSLINMACPDESTATFMNGGCPYSWLRKTFYSGSQLNAAVNYIKAHAGKVSPVTLDIGANDVLPLINSSTCTIASNWSTALSTFNTNFNTILQKLNAALAGKGDLIVMTYYDPYQNQCASNPNVLADLETMNADIQSDAATYNARVADVSTAFGGATTPNPNICSYTWMCASQHDIHASNTGYSVMASAFESAAGY